LLYVILKNRSKCLDNVEVILSACLLSEPIQLTSLNFLFTAFTKCSRQNFISVIIDPLHIA
jgi:hypothetical protein